MTPTAPATAALKGTDDAMPKAKSTWTLTGEFQGLATRAWYTCVCTFADKRDAELIRDVWSDGTSGGVRNVKLRKGA